MQISTLFRRTLLTGMAALTYTLSCHAGSWERIHPLTGVWGLHISQQGTLLASSYTADASDGIYW